MRAISSVCSGTQCKMAIPKLCPNTQQGICDWHKMNRNFTHLAEYKSLLLAEKDKSVLKRAEIDTIVQ